jgi:hypothetical protein
LLGIGIQKSFDTVKLSGPTPELELFDYQRDYLVSVAEGQTRPAITVRGEMTAVACRKSGIDKCLAMGCPSLTINTLPDLGSVLKDKWQKVLTRLSEKKHIVIAISPPANPADPLPKHMLRIFAKISEQFDAVLIRQSTRDSEALFQEIGFKKMTMFDDNAEDWFKMMESVDLVLAGRIHGGMVSIATATPTVIIPTDFRIQELVDIMHLPTISAEDLPKDADAPVDLLSLLNSAKVDFDEFEENRLKRIRQYKEVLGEAGVEMNPKHLSVIKEYTKSIAAVTA